MAAMLSQVIILAPFEHYILITHGLFLSFLDTRQADETFGVIVTDTTISPQYTQGDEDSSESKGRAELVTEPITVYVTCFIIICRATVSSPFLSLCSLFYILFFKRDFWIITQRTAVTDKLAINVQPPVSVYVFI
jgi:hypothetical protein